MTSRTGLWLGWLQTRLKAVVPLTAHAGGRLGMVGALAVHPMRNQACELVTTSFRPIVPLSLPDPTLTHL